MTSPTPKFSSSSLCFLVLLSTAAAIAAGAGSSPEDMTHLHFYFQETYAGPEQSSFLVASLNNTSSSFGNIRVYDNPMREAQDASSKFLGRVQGMAVTASMAADQALLTTQNFVFTAGEYNGSSLALLGRADQTASSIDRPIVGGSGQFRLARGYAITRLVEASATFIIAENDIYLLPSSVM